MFEHIVKKLIYLITHVHDQFETQRMCDKVILENGGTLKSVPDCYKNQKMCDKLLPITFMH